MILIVDMNWKKDSLGYFEFVLPIASIAQELEEYSVKHYGEVADQDIRNCSRIILSGTALKDNVTLGRPEKFRWIKTANKPVLGICAGMQTIGVVYGAYLPKCLEIGMTQITTLTSNPLFSEPFGAYSLHNYSVEVSEDFEALAESAKCIQAIKHKQRPIYGVLFHPEVRNKEILRRFIKLEM